MPARCATHQLEPAVATCARCGAFVCAGCVDARAEAALCRACLTRPAYRLGASARAKQALVWALLGLHGLVPLVGVSLWLVKQERRAIAEGAAPPAGGPWLEGATWVSVGAVLLWGVGAWVWWS